MPGKKKFATAVLVGGINDAVYAAYREFCERNKLGTEFGYDKYKKFAQMLLTSAERTPVIMKTAPEKINSVPVAAIILKELLKRFKPDSVIISDCGVKEGYLALVASGKEKGEKVDLSSPVPVFVEQLLVKKPKAEKPSAASAKKSDKAAKPAKSAKSGKSTAKSAKAEKSAKSAKSAKNTTADKKKAERSE